MGNVLFEINYNVKPEKREEFLNIINKLKSLYSNDSVMLYKVFEDNKINNNFTELFIFEDENKFEIFEDKQEDIISDLIRDMFDNIILDKKVKYSVKREF